jgi:hypothetical protein
VNKTSRTGPEALIFGKELIMPPLHDKAKESGIQAALDELVRDWPDVTTGKMFGSRAYRARGVLFAMIGGQGVILTKLQPDQREIATRESRAQPFVGHGKEIPAWMEFPLEDATGVANIASMVRNAYENALTDAAAA